jgi:hypothetical protein
MSPGTYLRKRRDAAALGVIQAAASLATLAWPRPVSVQEQARLSLRINDAEADVRPFALKELELLRNVFAFDVQVYLQLVAIHEAALAATCTCRRSAAAARAPSSTPARFSSARTAR